jgi:2-haloacid dehalogenase
LARVCVFDANETLLDFGALDPHFERVFGDGCVRRAWYLQLLQSALVATVTGGAWTVCATRGFAWPP